MTVPSRHAGPDPASPSFERVRRAGSRIGALRDDRMGAVNGMIVPSGHPGMLLARIPVFAKNGKSGIPYRSTTG